MVLVATFYRFVLPFQRFAELTLKYFFLYAPRLQCETPTYRLQGSRAPTTEPPKLSVEPPMIQSEHFKTPLCISKALR
jgi:hypothetical protein